MTDPSTPSAAAKPNPEYSLRILHISDLHAGGKSSDLRAERQARIFRESLWYTLGELAAERPIDLIALTGDVARTGSEEEYAEANKFVDELLRTLAVPRDRFFVVPGNHDIRRDIEPETWQMLRETIAVHPQGLSKLLISIHKVPPSVPEWGDPVLRREQAFWHWVASDLGRPELLPERSPHGWFGYRVPVSIPGIPFDIHIIGLDSAWLSGDDKDAGNLRLTDDQVGLLCLNPQGAPLPGFRLALVHHPLHYLADQASATRMLRGSVDLLLRGHQHGPLRLAYTDQSQSLFELAAGYLSVSPQEPTAAAVGFHVIDTALDSGGRPLRYEVRFRSWSNKGHWYEGSDIYTDVTAARLTMQVISGYEAAERTSPAALLPRLSQDDLVALVAEIFRDEGFSVAPLSLLKVDLIARRPEPDETVIIAVGIGKRDVSRIARDLLEARQSEKANRAVLVTSQQLAAQWLPSPVREFYTRAGVELWDEHALHERIAARAPVREYLTRLALPPETRKPGCIRLHELHLRNVRGIDTMHLHLANTRTTVMIGINGAGKTTVLDAIALAMGAMIRGLLDHEAWQEFLATRIKERDIKKHAESAEIRLHADVEGADVSWSTFGFRWPPIERPSAADTKALQKAVAVMHKALASTPDTSLPLVVYYRVNRAVIEVPLDVEEKRDMPQLLALADALVESGRDFAQFFTWFRQREDLENERAAAKPGYRDPQLTAVREAIYSFMEGFHDLRIQRDPLQMLVRKGEAILDVSQLSDGEKCLLALVGDLARRLVLANPGRPDPLHGSALVLIDEIDLHLHPRWQREVVGKLERTFPGCQFLVTTHSPQVLSGVPHEAVRLLDNFRLIEQVAPTEGRDATSILADVMGVPPHPKEIEDKLHEIALLIDKDKFADARREIDELARRLGENDAEIVRARTMINFLDE